MVLVVDLTAVVFVAFELLCGYLWFIHLDYSTFWFRFGCGEPGLLLLGVGCV